MENNNNPQLPTHPNHHSQNMTVQQKLIDWAGPIILLTMYFILFNAGKSTPSELIKTTGLVSVALLSVTLAIGSLSRFLPVFNVLKTHRKFWGISSFVFAAIHGLLVLAVYLDWNIGVFLDFSSSRFIARFTGLLSLVLLFVITATSFQIVFRKLPAHVWKHIQNLSYLALLLAVAHFFFAEQKDGAFMLEHILEHATYWFAIVVLLLRIIVAIFPKKDPIVPPVLTT